LPPQLRDASKPFSDLARVIDSALVTDEAERTVALRKLLEAKDCFVRSCLMVKQPHSQSKEVTVHSREEMMKRAAAVGIDPSWFEQLWKQFKPIILEMIIAFLSGLRAQPTLAGGVKHPEDGSDDCCSSARDLACALKCMHHAGEHVADDLMKHLDGCCNKK
jgi:hypothetical protein